jgi:hypothetical protein
MPPCPYKKLLEITEMDLYRCYVIDKDQICSRYDYLTISGYGSFCNWYKPPKTIIIPAWTETKITLRSYAYRDQCRGSGFKAQYRPIMLPTTVIPPTIWYQDTDTGEPYKGNEQSQ